MMKNEKTSGKEKDLDWKDLYEIVSDVMLEKLQNSFASRDGGFIANNWSCRQKS